MDNSIRGFNLGSYIPIILIGVVGYFFISNKDGSGSIFNTNSGYDKKSEKYSVLSTKYGKLASAYNDLFKADNRLKELKSNVKEIE